MSDAMQLSPAAAKGDWRGAVGGMWDTIGRLQFEYLVSRGLTPDHRLLDIGCGALRGGLHFIGYLNTGGYHGMDKEQWLPDSGVENELPAQGLHTKRFTLLQDGEFEFGRFDTTFDFALAQSVFTHLPWNSILRCLVNVSEVLAPTGQFYATFFEDTDGTHLTSTIVHDPGGIETFPDRNPYHYQFPVFEDLAMRAGLVVENLGDWNHPRNQRMLVFRQKG